MRLETISEVGHHAVDKLVPEHDDDRKLLSYHWRESLAEYEEMNLILREQLVHQGPWENDGTRTTDFNIQHNGAFHRVKLRVCICVALYWDGERERGDFVDMILSPVRELSLANLLSDKQLVAQLVSGSPKA